MSRFFLTGWVTVIEVRETCTGYKISISKSANLTIELETLTDGVASITAAKKKNIITDDAHWRAKIERGRRIFERIRVRTDKVTKSA